MEGHRKEFLLRFDISRVKNFSLIIEISILYFRFPFAIKEDKFVKLIILAKYRNINNMMEIAKRYAYIGSPILQFWSHVDLYIGSLRFSSSNKGYKRILSVQKSLVLGEIHSFCIRKGV